MLSALLLLQLAVTPPEAHQAEQLVHASMRDYDLGYFQQALAEAEQAYRIYPLAQILFNIGQCHRALKHWQQAAFFYQRYLVKVPAAPNRKLVEGLLEEVQQYLAADQPQAHPAPQASPQPTVVVVSPQPPPARASAPAPAPAVESAPAAATEPAAEKTVAPSGSHVASYVLGSVAVLSLAAMIYGIAYVQSFESLRGRVESPTSPTSYTTWNSNLQTASGEQSQAEAWQWVAVATGAVALGTGTAAGFTW